MESDYNTRNKNDSWISRKKEQAATDVNTIKSTHVILKELKSLCSLISVYYRYKFR